MSVVIKEVNSEKNVYIDQKLVGTVRKFCCGIDFRPEKRPKALFSILRVKYGDSKLTKCLEVLSTLDIPNKPFHLNFSYDTATDDKKLADYKLKLSEL